MDTDVQKTFFSFSKSPVPNSNEIKRWEAATIAEFKKQAWSQRHQQYYKHHNRLFPVY